MSKQLFQWQKDLIKDIMSSHWDDLKQIKEFLNNGKIYDLVLFVKEREDFISSKNHDWQYAGVDPELEKIKEISPQEFRSLCCDSQVKMTGDPEFEGSSVVTVNPMCTKCGKICGIRLK